MDDTTHTVSTVTCPFCIFPKEVWEEILGGLDNSDDVMNSMTAFSELRILLKGKEFSWLVAAVMPLICSRFLDKSDIVSCRLVSNRWKNAVASCFGKYPSRCLDKSVGMNQTHFHYDKCRIIGNMEILEQLFKHQMTLSEIKRNPLPGKLMDIYVEDETCLDNLDCPRKHCKLPGSVKMSKIITVVKEFGHQIRHVNFSLPYICYSNDESIIVRFVKPLLQLLSFLPNLKSLKLIAFTLPSIFMNEKGLQELEKLPSLSFQLEELELCFWNKGSGEGNLFKELNHYFMRQFVNHKGLKKLTMHSLLWRTEYIKLVPNLEEISLITGNQSALQQCLRDLRVNPITAVNIDVIVVKMLLSELLDMLVPHHKLESLVISGEMLDSLTIEPPENNKLAILLSVKYLRFGITKSFRAVGFRFLESFPSLEYLTVEIKQQVFSLKSDTDEGNERSHDPIRESIYSIIHGKFHKPRNVHCIWKKLPNLKLLTVVDSKNTYQFSPECNNVIFSNSGACHNCSIYTSKNSPK